MSSVLVTGANGFFGSAIVTQLRADGIAVRTTDLAAHPAVELPEYHSLDLLADSGLDSLVEGVECIVHAAGLAHKFGPSPHEDAFFAVNATTTERLMLAAQAAEVGHFVLISSVAVYGGHGKGVCTEATPCAPVGPYARSKYQAERNAIRLAEGSGMRVTILRPVTLYGEGDPGNVARLMRAIDRRRFVWIGTGENLKSLIYRGDAARACALATRRSDGERVQIYNVGSDPCTMREVVDGLATALNRRVRRWRVPASLALWGTAAAARLTPKPGRFSSLHAAVEKWLSDDVYDAGEFQRVFDFRAQTPLREGLRREVQWYRHSADA